MKMNTRVRYGLRAILRIAESHGGSPVSIATIAGEQQISPKYLEQVIGPLRRSGLLVSQKGVKGGYSLVREPDAITLWDVIQVLDNQPHLTECVENPDSCSRVDFCLAHSVWKRLDLTLQGYWRGYTLADLLQESGDGAGSFPCET